MRLAPPIPGTLLSGLNNRFGTWRGLIRLCLAWLELAAGRLRPFTHPELARVKRLVWVCSGNVCRSPYAHKHACDMQVPSASFGLSTYTGQPAAAEAITAAGRVGVDLAEHRATAWEDVASQDADLYVVMEVRQARELRRRLGNARAQVTLLGLWGRPMRPHLHDPMTLSPAYFDTCFRVIERSVSGLVQAWQQARDHSPDAPRLTGRRNGSHRRNGRVKANQRSKKKGSGSPASNTK